MILSSYRAERYAGLCMVAAGTLDMALVLASRDHVKLLLGDRRQDAALHPDHRADERYMLALTRRDGG